MHIPLNSNLLLQLAIPKDRGVWSDEHQAYIYPPYDLDRLDGVLDEHKSDLVKILIGATLYYAYLSQQDEEHRDIIVRDNASMMIALRNQHPEEWHSLVTYSAFKTDILTFVDDGGSTLQLAVKNTTQEQASLEWKVTEDIMRKHHILAREVLPAHLSLSPSLVTVGCPLTDADRAWASFYQDDPSSLSLIHHSLNARVADLLGIFSVHGRQFLDITKKEDYARMMEEAFEALFSFYGLDYAGVQNTVEHLGRLVDSHAAYPWPDTIRENASLHLGRLLEPLCVDSYRRLPSLSSFILSHEDGRAVLVLPESEFPHISRETFLSLHAHLLQAFRNDAAALAEHYASSLEFADFGSSGRHGTLYDGWFQWIDNPFVPRASADILFPAFERSSAAVLPENRIALRDGQGKELSFKEYYDSYAPYHRLSRSVRSLYRYHNYLSGSNYLRSGEIHPLRTREMIRRNTELHIHHLHTLVECVHDIVSAIVPSVQPLHLLTGAVSYIPLPVVSAYEDLLVRKSYGHPFMQTVHQFLSHGSLEEGLPIR